MRKALLFLLGLSLLIIQSVFSSGLLAATSYNYTDAFAKSILYYEASWCGPDAGDNRLKWRGPCHTEDGSDVGLDLTGGFHDAGDHVKFGLPQVYAASTLGWAYYEFKDTFVAKGQDGYMLKILKHFNDYFLKCYPNDTLFYYQCGDGTTDHSYWGPPELQTTSLTTRPSLYAATPSKPASDVCGSAAASLALMYLNYKDQDLTYADKCLTAAKKLYIFAKTYRGLSDSGGFYGSTSYLDDLCWGAIWLYVATNDSSYMTDVDSFMVEKGIKGGSTYANHWTHCWEDVFGGVFLKLAQLTTNSTYISIAEENLNYWMNGAPRTPAGECYINSWGALRYTAAECMMALVYYKTTGTAEYLNFAKKQIDYMLGDNPRNSSYVVGFGNNYPKFPHHRAASGRMEAAPAYEKKTDPEKHLLYGALVGGPNSDDTYADDVEQYANTEVAIDYNAGFVGAMAGLTKYFGADQTPEATPGIESGKEFYAKAKVLQESNQEATIDVFVYCDTMLPPHFVKGLSFKYFVDLSEYYKKGLTVNDVSSAINYAPNSGVISKLLPWDEANHIYYVEGSWPNTQNYGKIEFQFRLACYNSKDWDSSNDFSRTGLTDTLAETEYIPVYLNGVKVYGNEPTSTAVATPAFSPAGGSYSSAQSVTIECATSGAMIRYTTEGSIPANFSTVYSGPIAVTKTTTIKAYATAGGMTDSAVATATYTIGTTQQVATPTFSPAGGTYNSTQSVAITCATSGATIRYTTDGSIPDNFSTVYSGPIAVSKTTTIKAYATASGMSDSEVASATYTISSSASYLVSYSIVNNWGNGAVVDVTITNNSGAAISAWTLAWTFPGNQVIANLWNGKYTQNGTLITVTNVDHNGTIAANGGTVNFGFQLTYSGSNAKPASFTLNDTPCAVQ
jgi:endoglucanase